MRGSGAKSGDAILTCLGAKADKFNHPPRTHRSAPPVRATRSSLFATRTSPRFRSPLPCFPPTSTDLLLLPAPRPPCDCLPACPFPRSHLPTFPRLFRQFPPKFRQPPTIPAPDMLLPAAVLFSTWRLAHGARVAQFGGQCPPYGSVPLSTFPRVKSLIYAPHKHETLETLGFLGGLAAYQKTCPERAPGPHTHTAIPHCQPGGTNIWQRWQSCRGDSKTRFVVASTGRVAGPRQPGRHIGQRAAGRGGLALPRPVRRGGRWPLPTIRSR